MDLVSWSRIREDLSWHAVRAFRRDGSVESRCGRVWGSLQHPPEVSEDLPGSGKSCESCLRIVARFGGL